MRLKGQQVNTAAGLAAILLWSTTFAFARSLSEQLGPLTAGAAVYLLAGSMSLVPLAFWRGSRVPTTKPRPLYLAGCGTLFVFYTLAIYLAVGMSRSREQLLEISLVNYLWPAFTMVFSVLILKQRPRVWLLPGTVLALLGVFLVTTQAAQVSWASFRQHLHENPAAYGLAFAAAIAWALYSNLARRWAEPKSRGASDIFMFASGAVLLAARFATQEHSDWTGRAVAEALALAAMTAAAYLFWDTAMRKGNILLVVACSYFTPFISTLVSCAYLKVSPGPKLWLGCLVLICGSLLTWLSASDRATEVAEEVPLARS